MKRTEASWVSDDTSLDVCDVVLPRTAAMRLHDTSVAYSLLTERSRGSGKRLWPPFTASGSNSRVKMPKHVERQPRYWEEGHLSFSGGGFIGIYHVGVAIAFKKFAPHIASRKVLGASSGALASVCLVTNYPMDAAIHSITKMSIHCRALSLGPFDPRFNIFDIMKNDLTKLLHKDAHLLSSNKLFISLTRATTLENKVMSEFETKEELVEVLMASCFIPYFLGLVPPKVRGISYIDGGVTDNLPTHDEHTITVSPFAGIATIRPRPSNTRLPDIIYTPENAVRMVKTVFSPPPGDLAVLCQEGFDDALKFIKQHDLFACDSCASLLHRPERRQCQRCQDLIDEAQDAKVSDDYVWPLKEAELAEREKMLESPFLNSILMRTVKVLGAMVYFPVDASLAVIRKTYRSWDDISDVFKKSISSYAQHLPSCSSRELGSTVDPTLEN